MRALADLSTTRLVVRRALPPAWLRPPGRHAKKSESIPGYWNRLRPCLHVVARRADLMPAAIDSGYLLTITR